MLQLVRHRCAEGHELLDDGSLKVGVPRVCLDDLLGGREFPVTVMDPAPEVSVESLDTAVVRSDLARRGSRRRNQIASSTQDDNLAPVLPHAEEHVPHAHRRRVSSNARMRVPLSEHPAVPSPRGADASVIVEQP